MMKRIRNILNLNRRGMTLVEMMISLSVFAVVLGVLFSFMQNTSNSYQKTRQKVQFQQSVRAVISLMSREIRSTGCDPSSAGFNRFEQAELNILQCRMDLDGDGFTTGSNPDENITYTFVAASGELSRNTGANNQVILKGMQNVSFSYFDANGDELNGLPLNAVDRALVHFVELTLTGETGMGESLSFTTRVALRNG